MANKLQLKRSAVQGKVPTTSDLDLGEIGINTYDGKLYIKKDNGAASIVEVGAAGNLTDGDKGDITVASSGTSWTVDNKAITYAKIQDVSATDKLLGRSTAGAGVVEEITCTAAGRAILDDADASAQRTTLGLGTLATQSGTFSGTSSGTNTGDQTISLTGDVTGSGTSSFAATIANNAVTDAKLRQSAGLSVVGRSGTTTGNVADVTGTADQVLRVAGAGASLGFGAIDISKSAAVTGTLATGNGGTGLTTFTAADQAIFSSSSSALTAGTLPVAAGGTGVTSSTGSGSVVLATSPTLTTPVISSIVNTGTLTLPTSTDTLVGKATTDTLTNKTYDTAGTGNVLKVNGTQISDKTGTGKVVLDTSPTLVTPVLGTPTSGNLSNCTNVSLTAGVSGILPAANGGTGSQYTEFSGATTTKKTYTLPDASTTILTTNAAVTVGQGGTGATSATSYAVLCGGTTPTGALQSVSGVGSSGQVLTSNGASALPTWQAASGGTGRLLRAPQILTSGTSYTTPASCTAIYVEAWGGGGGGGGVTTVSASSGGAGAAGAYCAKYFTVTASTAYTYAIGAKGTGGTSGANAGTAGGNTTFAVGATTITATGGTAGAAGSAGGKTTASVAATNGDINGSSDAGFSFSSANQPQLSKGGSTSLGSGGITVGQNTNTAGANATGYGAGGSGAVANNSPSANAGGDGTQGIIRIWEFA